MQDVDDIRLAYQRLTALFDAIDGSTPSFRAGVKQSTIRSYERKIGWTFPEAYVSLLQMGNGMQGGNGSDYWLLRGTSDLRGERSFSAVEKEFLVSSPPSSTPSLDDFYRDELSPSTHDAYLVATNFLGDVALLRKDESGEVVPEVSLYRAPNLVEPLLVLADFEAFFGFLTGLYEQIASGDEFDELGDEDDLYADFDPAEELGDLESFLQEESDRETKRDYSNEDPVTVKSVASKKAKKDLPNALNTRSDTAQMSSLEMLNGLGGALPSLNGATPRAQQTHAQHPSPSTADLADLAAGYGLDGLWNKLEEAKSRHTNGASPSTSPRSSKAQNDFAKDVNESKQQPTGEIGRANRLVVYVVDRLLASDYLELMDLPTAREDLEDYMLRRLLRSRNPEEAVKNWFEVLLSASEIEDLYGTDQEIRDLLTRSFDEFER